jgi:predicted RNA-binding protein YlxR (DUF448 family)
MGVGQVGGETGRFVQVRLYHLLADKSAHDTGRSGYVDDRCAVARVAKQTSRRDGTSNGDDEV